MTIGCSIWMICLKLNRFFYGLSRMLQFSEFVWALSYSVWDGFNKFLLIDATDRSKIRSDQKRFFIGLSLYTLSFFANTPFKNKKSYFMCSNVFTLSQLSRFQFLWESTTKRLDVWTVASWQKYKLPCNYNNNSPSRYKNNVELACEFLV